LSEIEKLAPQLQSKCMNTAAALPTTKDPPMLKTITIDAALTFSVAGAAISFSNVEDRSPDYVAVEGILDDQRETLIEMYKEGASTAELDAVILDFERRATPYLWELSEEERVSLKNKIEEEVGALWGLSARAGS